MHVIAESVESEWDLCIARMNSIVAVGFNAVHEEEVKHREYLVLEGSTNAYDSPTWFFGKLGASLSFPRQTIENLFRFVYKTVPGERVLCYEQGRELWRLIVNSGRRTLNCRTKIEKLQKYVNEEADSRIYEKRW